MPIYETLGLIPLSMQNTQLTHQQHQANKNQFALCLLANDMRSAANVGGLFRLADALGAEIIYLTGESVVPPNRDLKKASRSTVNSVPYQYRQDATQLVSDLKKSGYKILSLEITSSSIDLTQLSLTQHDKVCLILGSENHGVNQALLDQSDNTVHISMQGSNSSMNVVTACAIASYQITRQLMPIATADTNH